MDSGQGLSPVGHVRPVQGRAEQSNARVRPILSAARSGTHARAHRRWPPAYKTRRLASTSNQQPHAPTERAAARLARHRAARTRVRLGQHVCRARTFRHARSGRAVVPRIRPRFARTDAIALRVPATRSAHQMRSGVQQVASPYSAAPAERGKISPGATRGRNAWGRGIVLSRMGSPVGERVSVRRICARMVSAAVRLALGFVRVAAYPVCKGLVKPCRTAPPVPPRTPMQPPARLANVLSARAIPCPSARASISTATAMERTAAKQMDSPMPTACDAVTTVQPHAVCRALLRVAYRAPASVSWRLVFNTALENLLGGEPQREWSARGLSACRLSSDHDQTSPRLSFFS